MTVRERPAGTPAALGRLRRGLRISRAVDVRKEKTTHMLRRGCKALAAAAVVWGVLLSAAPAEALPITGGIRFAGAFEPVDDWSTVTGIDIFADSAIVACDPVVAPCTGVFDGQGLATATYNDFSFDPLGGNITPLWEFNGFGFNLTQIVSFTRGEHGVVIQGMGILFGNGFDPTLARWSFSADETLINGWSSTVSALPVSVPDSGSTLLLMGAAMLALGYVRSRFY